MNLSFEKNLLRRYRFVIGLDEVGRGALAGPVVACAMLFARSYLPAQIRDSEARSKSFKRLTTLVGDSKKLRPERRQEISRLSKEAGLIFSCGLVGPRMIDRLGIEKGTFLAMKRAIQSLLSKLKKSQRVTKRKICLLIDGNRFPKEIFPELFRKTIIDGDARVFSIALASVLAKVYRDKLMIRLQQKYPQYNFHRHKGYGTKEHLMLIKKHRPSPVHRKSFLSNLT